MRHVTDHQIDADSPGDFNNALTIIADPPGPGGASQRYQIALQTDRGLIALETIAFQTGSPSCGSINGITNEALLAIVADRLRGFQEGPHPCAHNDDALVGVDAALLSLKVRTVRILAGFAPLPVRADDGDEEESEDEEVSETPHAEPMRDPPWLAILVQWGFLIMVVWALWKWLKLLARFPW